LIYYLLWKFSGPPLIPFVSVERDKRKKHRQVKLCITIYQDVHTWREKKLGPPKIGPCMERGIEPTTHRH
jgi:hypothetical protein